MNSPRGRRSVAPEGTSVRVVLKVEEPEWRVADLALLRRAARLALLGAKRMGGLTVLLADDQTLCVLNERFRRKPNPTNVLSFPVRSPDDGYLGDIAIAFGVAAREAAAARKSLSHHAAHLVVHGVLHLLGYDHQSAREARIMEGLEVTILKQMRIGDPYALPVAAE
jgi:probable rRNA maturation factor